MCPGGEEVALKAIGVSALAGSNPVHSVCTTFCTSMVRVSSEHIIDVRKVIDHGNRR